MSFSSLLCKWLHIHSYQSLYVTGTTRRMDTLRSCRHCQVMERWDPPCCEFDDMNTYKRVPLAEAATIRELIRVGKMFTEGQAPKARDEAEPD